MAPFKPAPKLDVHLWTTAKADNPRHTISRRHLDAHILNGFLTKLFNVGDIVMLPYPGASDWKAEDVFWYPVRFLERSEHSAGTAREFKFRWLDCVDWSFHVTEHHLVPLLIPKTYQREKKFCEEVSETVFKSSQIGKIHLPSYVEPEQSASPDHPLVAIFESAVCRLSILLTAFSIDHPVVKSYTDYFATKPSTARDTEIGLWLSNIRLCPTPELESLMEAPIQALLAWKLPGVAPLERKRRILSVGYALLHLLAIQHELGEELNLNGDTFLELFDKTIVPCKLDTTEALRAMFLATDPVDLKHRKGWNLDQFSRHMLRFNADHTI
ncbi:hypothetical protein C8R44DRAFT_886375 [Mycena epipterygia]|nr:hypothetical protein C8R44DRAFT_886375 [Mycena epipterygia]